MSSEEEEIKRRVLSFLARGRILDPPEPQPRVIKVVPQSQPTTMYALDAMVQRARQLGLLLPPPFLPIHPQDLPDIQQAFTSLFQPPQAQQREQVEVVKCPKCGLELPKGLNFCPECGESLQKPKKKEVGWWQARVML